MSASHRISRRCANRAILAAFAAPMVLTRRAFGQQPANISVRMGYTWPSSQYYSIFLLGKEKGFFREAGVEPTFVEGTGSGTGVQLIASGKADLGAAIAAGAVINGVSQGAKIRMVAATLPTNPIAVISTEATPIKSPQQMVGKTIGIPPGTEQEQLWPAFLQVNKLQASSIKVVSIAGDALPAALGMARVDGYVSYSTDIPFLEKAGMKVATMLFSDFGIVYAPGEGIVASQDMIDKHPEIVRAFLSGLDKTFAFASVHPEEAAAAGARAFPDSIQEPVALSTIGIAMGLIKSATKGGSMLDLFKMSDQEWQGTIDLLTKFGGLKNPPPASQIFTNEFLPKS
jgi:NitT/TauT family transport system substrate-binding protein